MFKLRKPSAVALGAVLLLSVTGAVVVVVIARSVAATATDYEAESALISLGVVESGHAGFSGTGFVNYDNLVGSYVEWTANAIAAGPASLAFRYANGSRANLPMNITVNGNLVASGLAFKPTGAWTTWQTVIINALLTAGPNKIRATATNANGGPNVDKLTVGSQTDTQTPSAPGNMRTTGKTATGTGGGTPGNLKIGYYVAWGAHTRNYQVKNIDTSGSAAKLTHINYAFGNVINGKCVIGDSYTDYDRFYDAASSVDGVADNSDAGALRGNFNQLRKLKKKYPHLKMIYSFGGWTWSRGLGRAAANPTAFANSCYNLVKDPRWADVFDGIDIDWEYPNACGLSCDTSGFSSFKNLMSALRSRFGSGNLVTAAITADAISGGKIDAADYAGAAPYVNWYLPMTYDYFGAWDADGPTAPHSPLTSFSGIQVKGSYADAAIKKLKSKGIPASKLLLGVGFYGRGWTGVTRSTPGGSAKGAAPGTYEAGVEDYKVLKVRCPSTGMVAGTAYAHCGGQWWGYDTPSTIGGKMSYAKRQGLAGAFVWELSGDTANGELITAIWNGIG
jgi:chitinase